MSKSQQTNQEVADDISLDPFQLISKEDENFQRLLGEDGEEMFIKREIEMYRLQEEMINNRDFTFLLSKAEELFNIYNQKKNMKIDDFIKLLKEILRQLFKNEIQIISNFAN